MYKIFRTLPPFPTSSPHKECMLEMIFIMDCTVNPQGQPAGAFCVQMYHCHSTEALQSDSNVAEGVLVGLGNPLRDMTLHADTDFLQRYDLQADGAILATDKHIDMFLEMADMKPTSTPGGSAQNSIRVAQWLLQRPRATTFFGSVGDDSVQGGMAEEVSEVGVKVFYETHPGMQTGLCATIITGEHRENRSMVTDIGAAKHFTHQFLQQEHHWSYVEKASFFYISGSVVHDSRVAVMRIADHCVEHDKTLVANLHANFLAKHYADSASELMQYVDILFGNRDEAVEFSKQAGFDTSDIKDIAAKIVALPKANPNRSRWVIFTQGKRPIILAMEGKVSEIVVEPISQKLIQDTIGCGDAFAGGFLAQLVKGASVDECIRCGSYAAKVVLQNKGCTFPKKPDFHWALTLARYFQCDFNIEKDSLKCFSP